MLRWLLLVYVLVDVGAVAVWRSEVTLWEHASRLAPHSVRSLDNYARALINEAPRYLADGYQSQ